MKIKNFFKKNGSKIFWVAGGVILGAGGMYIAAKNGVVAKSTSVTINKFFTALEEHPNCYSNLDVLEGKATIADLGKVGEDLASALESAKLDRKIHAVFVTTE